MRRNSLKGVIAACRVIMQPGIYTSDAAAARAGGGEPTAEAEASAARACGKWRKRIIDASIRLDESRLLGRELLELFEAPCALDAHLQAPRAAAAPHDGPG